MVPELILVTVVIPLKERLGCCSVSLTLIPIIESTTTVDSFTFTVDITVRELVASPTDKIGSFTVACVELTVVVVPSTCKLPLMITSPSLLKPSGNGSIKILLSAPAIEDIILFSIRMKPNLVPGPETIRLPPTTTFFSTLAPPSNLTEPSSFVVA